MSKDLLSSLVDQLMGPLRCLAAAADDPWVLDRLLQSLDSGDPRLTGGLVEALKGLAQSVNAFEAVQTGPPSLQTVVEVLQGIRELVAGVGSLSQTSGSNYAQLGEDLLNLMALTWLRAASPLAYQIAATLGIAELKTLPQITIGDETVRLSISIERLAFDRIGTLFTDPLALIREQLPSPPLATVQNAQQTADIIVDRIAGLLNALGVPWSYGYPPEHEKFLGNIAPLAAYTMAIYLPTPIVGDDVAAGVCINLSSAAADDLGIVLTPFGALTLQTTVGRWAVSLELGADIQALAFGGGKGFRLLASAGSTEAHALAKASITPPPADPTSAGSGSAGATTGSSGTSAGPPAAILGSSDGTRIEFGAPQLTANLDASIASVDGGFSAGTGPSALVIHPSDGDSFLSSLLPSQGARLDFDLGVTWSRSKGLRWQGGAGMDVILPVGLTLGSTSGGLTLVSVELDLQINNATASINIGATVSASIGPLQATVAGMGVGATLFFPDSGGSLTVADLDLGFSPPTGVGLAIDSAGVSGGGFLSYSSSKSEYSGVLQLKFNDLALQAFGLVTTKVAGASGYSLIALVDANFPPVQLGWGFTLNGVGGLLAVHRSASVDALRAAVKAGKLSFLFPKNAITNAAQILGQLDTLFPTAPGRFLFGPMALIAWGTPTVLTASVAVIFELPEPIRIVLLADIEAKLPDPSEPLVHLNIDALGVLDLSQGELSLDASLFDSKLITFSISGDMALRATWSSQREFLLAVGGFHPQFTPPADFPALKRVTIDMPSGMVSKLRLAAYLALTSNSVQFGATLDVFIGVSGCGLTGHLGFDALLQLDPFLFSADISGSVAITADGDDLASVALNAILTGPAPWNIAGSFSIHVLFFDVGVSFSQSWGLSAPTEHPSSVDVGALLGAALADPRNWNSQLPAGLASLVSTRQVEDPTAIFAHPLALLEVHEQVVPLGLTISRFGEAIPSGTTTFSITDFRVGSQTASYAAVQDDFAPAQFFDLSDAEKLSRPPFERHDAGAIMSGNLVTNGSLLAKAIDYETFFIDTPGVVRTDEGVPHPFPWADLPIVMRTGSAAQKTISRAGSLQFANPGNPIRVAAPAFALADTVSLTAQTATAAGKATYSDVLATLAATVAATPARKGSLQVLATHELAKAT
jgi:hypothetical protein